MPEHSTRRARTRTWRENQRRLAIRKRIEDDRFRAQLMRKYPGTPPQALSKVSREWLIYGKGGRSLRSWLASVELLVKSV